MASALSWLPVAALVLSAGALMFGVVLARRRSLRVLLGCVLGSVVVMHGFYVTAAQTADTGLRSFAGAMASNVCLAAALLVGVEMLLAELEERRTPRSQFAGLLLFALGGALCLQLPGSMSRFDVGGQPVPGLGWLGQAVVAGALLSLLFAIASIEQLLRRLRDPLRYQMKFVLIGLGALAVAQVHTLSLLLLEGLWLPHLFVTHSVLNVMSLLLVCLGVWRLRTTSNWSRLTTSAGGYGSLSLFIVAGYLLAMGLTAELVPRAAYSSYLVLGVSAAFAGLLTLLVLLFARSVRAKLRRSFVRTFKRSKYDYRSKWLELSEAFHGVAAPEKILDRFIDLLGNTFGAGRISIWLTRDADKNLYQARSVNVEVPAHGLSPRHPLVTRLMAAQRPLLIDAAQREADEFCRELQVSLLAPIGATELFGLVVLSEEVAGPGYDQDDVDLLQAMASHVGLLLAHSKLAQAHQADAEMRALHEFSMFCMHDLKNLAGRLSLVAQNAKRFGNDPDFQTSALRTVSSTVERMTQLIRKLSYGARRGPQLAPGELEADLFQAVEQAVGTLKHGIRVVLPDLPSPRPRVKLDPEALSNVFLNLITNAEQAMPDGGSIRVTYRAHGGEHIVGIQDAGAGIAPDALAVLFEPFRSSKQGGLGIGLYQCKTTIEACGGQISVNSKLGSGTCVELRLPAVASKQEGSAA